MVNTGWIGSIRSEIFLQMTFIIFQGCLIKQAVFLIYSATFACSRMLFCIKCWSLGFEILSPFFSECSFHWLQHFFSLVLVISLSWYLHLYLHICISPDTTYLALWKPNGLSKHLKGHQVIGLDLSTSPKLAVKWIILKWYYVVDLILDSIWIILVFYCKFCAFKIILFYIAYF